MQKKFYLLFAVTAIFFCSIFISAEMLYAEGKPTILLYGREGCFNCKAMRRNLDSEKIPYTFYDVDKDASRNSEMWSKVRTVSNGGSVTLPVMDIGGKVMICPQIDEVKKLYQADNNKQETYKPSADNTENASDSILIYGRAACGNCKAMKRSLDAENIAYTFYDVDTDKSKNSEMWKKVYTVSKGGSVTFPVMDVKGKVLISPRFNEVKEILASKLPDKNSNGDNIADNTYKKPEHVIIPDEFNDPSLKDILDLKNKSAIFQNKYYINNVWDAQRFPASPSANKDWKLMGLKTAFDPKTRSSIDWGKARDRYLAFDLELDPANNSVSINDNLFNSGNKYRIILNLFENNGTKVKTISDWGKFCGFGSAGFMYIQEGYYGTFFTNVSYKENNTVIYKTDLGNVTKLSEIADYNYKAERTR